MQKGENSAAGLREDRHAAELPGGCGESAFYSKDRTEREIAGIYSGRARILLQ
jgi:hypothetical protein